MFLYRLLLFSLGCGWVADPTSGNFAISRPVIHLLAEISPGFYILDASLILAMTKASPRFCSVPGLFHEQSQRSMHENLLWSIGSFSKTVNAVIQLSRRNVLKAKSYPSARVLSCPPKME